MSEPDLLPGWVNTRARGCLFLLTIALKWLLSPSGVQLLGGASIFAGLALLLPLAWLLIVLGVTVVLVSVAREAGWV